MDKRRIYTLHDSLTFEFLATKYFDRVQHEHKTSYLRTEQANYQKHLLPYFKDAKIKEIEREHIYEFRQSLLDTTTLHPNTINKILLLLKLILDIAVEESIFEVNPCKHIKKLKFSKKEMKFYTLEEFKTFIAVIDPKISEREHCFYLLFYTLYFTGLRIGELLALTWKDLDTFKNA